MREPHAALVNLAAGRPGQAVDRPGGLFVSSVDHRMTGLLATDKTALASLTDHDQAHLSGVAASMWAQNTLMRERVAELASIAGGLGIEVAIYKGVVHEERWYDDIGQRVVTDIDLILAPGSAGQALDLVSALDPESAETLASLGPHHPQSLDVRFKDVPVDIHFDPLKLEVLGTRESKGMWNRVEQIEMLGVPVLTPDPELALMLTLLHTTRDRFRWLGAYADVARIIQRAGPNIEDSMNLARIEGVEDIARFALKRISRYLNLEVDHGQTSRTQDFFLTALWPDRRALAGTPAIHPPPRSTLKMALIARGRHLEAARGWVKRLFPSPAMLDHYHPDSTGPYLVRVFRERLRRRWQLIRERFSRTES